MNRPRTYNEAEFPFAVAQAEVYAAQELLRDFANSDAHPEDYLAEHPDLGLHAGRIITAACHPHLNQVVGTQNAVFPDGTYIPDAHMRRLVGEEHVAIQPRVNEQVVRVSVFQNPYKEGRLKITSLLPLINCPSRQQTDMRITNHESPAQRVIVPTDAHFGEHLQAVCGYVVDALDYGVDTTAAYIPPTK